MNNFHWFHEADFQGRCSSLSKHRPSGKAPSSTKEKIWSAGQKKRHAILRVSVLALPIFPGRRQPSIVGRNELNYRVRNGNGWTLALISTNYLLSGLPENILYYIVFSALCQGALYSIFKPAQRLKIEKEKQRRE